MGVVMAFLLLVFDNGIVRLLAAHHDRLGRRAREFRCSI